MSNSFSDAFRDSYGQEGKNVITDGVNKIQEGVSIFLLSNKPSLDLQSFLYFHQELNRLISDPLIKDTIGSYSGYYILLLVFVLWSIFS